MESLFKAEEWNRLTPAERVQRCRLMAAETRALATVASSDLRLHYSNLTEEWLQLAQEIERAAIPAHPN
jgi:hypothetical protein